MTSRPINTDKVPSGAESQSDFSRAAGHTGPLGSTCLAAPGCGKETSRVRNGSCQPLQLHGIVTYNKPCWL